MKTAIQQFYKSIRVRLLVGTMIWLVLVVFGTGWALTDFFDNYSKRQLSSELNIQMNQLLAAFRINDDGKAQLDFELNDPRFNKPLSGLYWQIDEIKDNGQYQSGVLRSRSLWDQSLAVPVPLNNEKSLLELLGPDDTNLFASTKLINPAEGQADYVLIIAIDKNVLDSISSQFNFMVALFLSVLAVTMALALLLQIWLSLKPLAALRHRLENVLNGTDKQIRGTFPSEIQPLVSAFNRVLKANEDMVEQARAQAGNLAHALKTPLSIIANSVANDDSEQGQLITEQIKSAQHHIGHHLARARATAIGLSQNKLAVAKTVVDGLARTMERLYANKNIHLHTNELSDKWAFIGEINDLQEMLGNLIDNAYKWANSNIWLNTNYIVDKNKSWLEFTIEDDGKGLHDKELNMLFRRGIRLDEKTPGTGLGLAIVSDLAIAYGGYVRAETSAHGGLKVVLFLPARLLTSSQ